MGSFYDVFKMEWPQKSEVFIRTFDAEIKKEIADSPFFSTEFGGHESKDDLIHILDEEIYIDVEDLFCGGSAIDHERRMNEILLKCIKSDTDFRFSAIFDVGCFLCGDGAFIEYQYDGEALIEKSRWDETDDMLFPKCDKCGREYYVGELVEEFLAWEPLRKYYCPECGAEAKIAYSYYEDEFRLNNGVWTKERKLAVSWREKDAEEDI